MDEVGLLAPRQRHLLESTLQEYNRRGKVQLQIYITSSLQGFSIEEASLAITDHWKLGDKQLDNGILFLIAPKERKMRMEIGQGLEGVLPDILVKQVQSETIVPAFRKHLMAEGVMAGTFRLLEVIDRDYYQSHPELLGEAKRSSQSGFIAEIQRKSGQPERLDEGKPPSRSGFIEKTKPPTDFPKKSWYQKITFSQIFDSIPFADIFEGLVLLILFVFFGVRPGGGGFGGRGSSSSSGGGSSGSSGWSGGGGGFSGGGASSDW